MSENKEQPVSLCYEVVANRLNVLAIAVPLRTQITPQETLESALQKALVEWTRDDSVFLVRDGSRIHGYLIFDDEVYEAEPSGDVGSKAKPIKCDMLVTSSTPLLDLVPLFEERPFYFVIDRNEITHVVWFGDVDKPPMRLCLFSLCLELESEILRELEFHRDGIDHFLKKLPKDRRCKAKKVCKQNGRKQTPDNLLMSTNFADRHRMLRADPKTYDSLPFESRNKAHRFFNRVERVRNQIAHGDSILPILNTPQKLREFVDKCRDVISSLRQARLAW